MEWRQKANLQTIQLLGLKNTCSWSNVTLIEELSDKKERHDEGKLAVVVIAAYCVDQELVLHKRSEFWNCLSCCSRVLSQGSYLMHPASSFSVDWQQRPRTANII